MHPIESAPSSFRSRTAGALRHRTGPHVQALTAQRLPPVGEKAPPHRAPQLRRNARGSGSRAGTAPVSQTTVRVGFSLDRRPLLHVPGDHRVDGRACMPCRLMRTRRRGRQVSSLPAGLRCPLRLPTVRSVRRAALRGTVWAGARRALPLKHRSGPVPGTKRCASRVRSIGRAPPMLPVPREDGAGRGGTSEGQGQGREP